MRDLAFGIIVVLLFIILIVSFCVILIKLYIQKIKKYNQIIYQKEIDYQVQLNQSILETQEQTFQNISQELHDDAGQQLTYINFQLETLKLDSQRNQQQLQPISVAVQNVASTIRNLSHLLNNQSLAHKNLIKAIEEETVRLNNLKKINVAFINNHSIDYSFSSDETIILYRVFQEITNNVLKHSCAKKYTIQIDQTPKIKFTFIDDGVGFDFEEINKESLGLKTLKYRLEIIDYQLEINTQLHQGTTIIVKKK